MSKALITEGYLTDIANAIRAKNGSADTYTPPQMAAAIQAIPTGGGDVFLYSMGSFYGDPSGTITDNLSCQLAGAIGCKALLIVMHRDDNITVSGGMELIHKTRSGGYNQWVSIYQKVMTSSAETVTVTQASSIRMCACSVYVNAGVSLSAPIAQEIDNDSSTYRYTIAPRPKPCIAVINHVYAGNQITTILPTHAALPISVTNGTAETIRLAVFIMQDINAVVYSATTEVTDASKSYNRLLLYEVN